MIRPILLFGVLVHLTELTTATRNKRQNGTYDVLSWIDPLIGSSQGGNVFAGATLPYGMAKG